MNATATLKMAPSCGNTVCWDRLTLVVKTPGTIQTMIPFKDRSSVLDLYRQVMIAFYDCHQGTLEVSTEGTNRSFEQDVWMLIASALDQWFTEYMMLTQ